MVDKRIQLESVKPSGRELAALCSRMEDVLAFGAQVVANDHMCGIVNGNSRAGILKCLEQGRLHCFAARNRGH